MRQAKRPYLIVLLLAAQSLPGVAHAAEVPARGAATGGIDSGSQPVSSGARRARSSAGVEGKSRSAECPRCALR